MTCTACLKPQTENGKKRLSDKDFQLVGTLKQAPDGFVYIDVPDELLLGFLQAIGDKKAKKPPYFTRKYNNIGAHISVIYCDELEGNEIEEIGNEYKYTISNLQSIKPQHWKGVNRIWLLNVKCPELQNLRAKYGLSKKIQGHDFHITVAMNKSINESQFKLNALYEEAPEGIAYSNALQLGRKLAKAIKNKSFDIKRRQRRPSALCGPLPKDPHSPQSLVPRPRHRKFFGLGNPLHQT